MSGGPPLTEEQQYRLLDVLYAQLETTDRVRHQLLRLRNDQIKLRLMATQGGLALVVFVLLAAIPALWSFLPPDFQGKWFCVGILAFCAVLYALQLISQWKQSNSEKTDLSKMLPAGAESPIEEQPEYILTQITSWGTRLSAAHEVLGKGTLDENTRSKFHKVAQYCTERLNDLSDTIEALHKQGKWDEPAYVQMREWVVTSLAHPREGKPG